MNFPAFETLSSSLAAEHFRIHRNTWDTLHRNPKLLNWDKKNKNSPTFQYFSDKIKFVENSFT